MEQIRVDARDLRLRTRCRRDADARMAEAAAPLLCSSAGGGPTIDDDLLSRIDEVLGMRGLAGHEDEVQA